MYARHLVRQVAKSRGRMAKRLQARRRELSILVSVLLVAGFGVGYVAHLHGRFSRLKKEIKEARNPAQPSVPMPGGQEAVTLRRALLIGGSMPEFLSATILPGRGMDVLQITAYVPGRGEVSLLASPSLEDATKLLDRNDPAILRMGGPLEVPWAGRILGNRSSDGSKIFADWHGHGLTLPWTATRSGAEVAAGGFLLPLPAENLANNTMPDGGAVQGSFEAGNFNGQWPSKTQVGVDVQLSSRAVELKVTARNTGETAEPLGIGWSPHFMIPSGNRADARVRLPSAQLEEERGGRATGRVLPLEGTAADYSMRGGKALGTATLSGTYVHLRPGFLDSGPVVELRDTDTGVGLRMTAMTPLIRAIAVEANAGDKVVTIRPQMNYDDPLSRVWTRDEDTGLLSLEPGRSVQWRVRLELFVLTKGELPL